MKQEILTDVWIEETFKTLMLPADSREAKRLLGRMNRLILAALQTLMQEAGGG